MRRSIAWAALLIVMAGTLVGANRSAKGYYTWYDCRFGSAVDADIRYFAKAGSLTAVADSSIGSVRELELLNLKVGGAVNVRVYHKGGNYAAGTALAYTLVQLAPQVANLNASGAVWGNPEGLDVVGIRLMTDPGANGFLWRAGR